MLRIAVALPLLAAPAWGQAFTYSDFSNTTGLDLVGSPSVAGTVMRITPSAADQTGAVWRDQPVAVNSGFQCTFEFLFGTQTFGGADGMAFVIHNDPRGPAALGEGGTSLGYTEYLAMPTGTAIVNSLAIELDAWLSAPANDLSDNEISIHTSGTAANVHEESASLGSLTPLIGMSDGAVHTLRITYVPGNLSVFLDDLTTPVLSVPYTFSGGGTLQGGGPVGGLNLINGTSAYVGFTAATGGAYQDHDLISWDWDYPSLGSNYCTPAAANTTGGSGVIVATGSAVTADNNLTLTAAGLPQNQFGIFANGPGQGFIPMPGGSLGNLCLAGGIGRYNGPGQIQNSGTAGTFSLSLNLNQTPTPAGPVAIAGGQTWHFQAWYRDFINGTGAVSNFTDAVTIMFQ